MLSDSTSLRSTSLELLLEGKKKKLVDSFMLGSIGLSYQEIPMPTTIMDGLTHMGHKSQVRDTRSHT